MRNVKVRLGAIAVIAGFVVLGMILAKPTVAQLRAALVKDLNNAAYQPFAADPGTKTFAAGSVGLTQDLITVPAGKRAVIEHFSGLTALESTNSFIRFVIVYTSGGSQHRHEVVPVKVGGSFVAGIDILTFSQPVRAYADPGTTIMVLADRRSSGGYASVECHLSGYFVDITP